MTDSRSVNQIPLTPGQQQILDELHKCQPMNTGPVRPLEAQCRIWVMHCPFRKSGSPVLGTFGAKVEGVVIFKMADWQQLCRDVPQLQTMQFEVGSYD